MQRVEDASILEKAAIGEPEDKFVVEAKNRACAGILRRLRAGLCSSGYTPRT